MVFTIAANGNDDSEAVYPEDARCTGGYRSSSTRRLRRPPLGSGANACLPGNVDENAVTLRLLPVRWHQRVLPEALRWVGAAASVAAVAGGLLFFASPSEAARIEVPAPSPQPVAAAGSAGFDAVFASSVGTTFAAGFFGWGAAPRTSTLLDAREVEEIIVIEDDDDDDGIVILDDASAAAPVAKVSRAQRQARARSAAISSFEQGTQARALGDRTAALRHFESAITVLPSYAPAAAALAELHIQRREHEVALGYAKQASRSSPKNRDYLLLLGDTYLLTKRQGAARKAWRKARRLRR